MTIPTRNCLVLGAVFSMLAACDATPPEVTVSEEVGTTEDAMTQMLLSPSFESQSTISTSSTPWRLAYAASGVSISTTSPNSGAQALAIVPPAASDARVQQQVNVSTNRRYSFSAWLSATNMASGDIFKIEVKTTGGSLLGSASVTASTSGYVERTVTFDSGANTSVLVSVYAYNASGTTTYRADSTILRRASQNGTWIYDPVTVVNGGAAPVIAFCQAHGITEVYLEIGSGAVLADDDLPDFIQDLTNAGIATEASMGMPCWVNDNASMEAKIQDVLDYQDMTGVEADMEFSALHLDVEPWADKVGPNCGLGSAWLGPLLDTYDAANIKLNGRLPLSVDVSGSIFDDMPATDKQAVLDKSDKVVLMNYETEDLATVFSYTNDFLANVNPAGPEVLVAIRQVDFDTWPAEVAAIEEEFEIEQEGYLGWAIFDYDAAN